jgi:hypothetical protein
MGLSVTPQASPLTTKLVVHDNLNHLPMNNVTGTSGKIYTVEIDNTANPATPVYLKLYDHLAPAIGSTPPDWEFRCEAGGRFSCGVPVGMAFLLGLSMACVLEAGTVGSTDPVNPVIVRLATT